MKAGTKSSLAADRKARPMLAHRPCSTPRPNLEKGPVVAPRYTFRRRRQNPAVPRAATGAGEEPNDPVLHRDRSRLRGVLEGRSETPDGRSAVPARVGH